jgi:hypothetical protein
MEYPDATIRPFLHITYSLPSTLGGTTPFFRLPPQDTSIILNATNYSSHTTLMTFTWPDHQVANAILMKFDLSGIPAGAVVQEATVSLALVESDTAPDATYTVTAHKVVGKNPVIAAATGYTADGVTSWTPTACCYGGVPLAQADISPAYDTRAIDKTRGYKAWTITAMAQEWLATPATNFGLLLNADPAKLAGRHRFFASMEHPDTRLRPHLRITYSVGTSAGCCRGESSARFVRGGRHDQGQSSFASTASFPLASALVLAGLEMPRALPLPETVFLGPEGQQHAVSTARGVGGKLGDQAALTEARFTDHPSRGRPVRSRPAPASSATGSLQARAQSAVSSEAPLENTPENIPGRGAVSKWRAGLRPGQLV